MVHIAKKSTDTGAWAGVHRERLSPYHRDHCLEPANSAAGDSFDTAEAAVASSLGYLPRWYFPDAGRYQNWGHYSTCGGARAYNDGVTLGIDVTHTYYVPRYAKVK